MFQRLRTAHPLGYCLLTEVLFLALILVGLLALLHTRDILGADVFRLDGYFTTMLQKLFVIELDKKDVAMLAQLADRLRETH